MERTRGSHGVADLETSVHTTLAQHYSFFFFFFAFRGVMSVGPTLDEKQLRLVIRSYGDLSPPSLYLSHPLHAAFSRSRQLYGPETIHVRCLSVCGLLM